MVGALGGVGAVGALIGVADGAAIETTGSAACWGIDVIGGRGIVGVGGWSTVGVGSCIPGGVVAIVVG